MAAMPLRCRLLVSALLALGLLVAPAGPVLATHTVDPIFAEYYYTHDGPRVLGPAISSREENVQYFEKGRLEDHRGQGLPSAWQFMFGRLAADLITAGARLPVAGETGPTYADLAELTEPGRRLPPPARVDGVQPVATGVFVPYDSRLRAAPGYVVPADFWAYITNSQLFPAGWLHAIGLPMTPAIPVDVTKAGQARRLLLQVFERTVLTYDAVNPEGWRLERANVGVHSLTNRTPGAGFPDWRGEYFNNAELNGSPVLVRNDTVIDFDWKDGEPGPGVLADSFSVRWTRSLSIDEAGSYRVIVRADDGVRVWLAERLIIDQWRSVRRVEGYIWLEPGQHAVRVEYHEDGGNASIDFDLDRIESYPNWKGRYYDNLDLDDPPFFVRNDSSLDFDWDDGSPGSGLSRNNFSVRWTREPRFDSGVYRFTVTADDGVRLYVEGDRVLNQWNRRGDITTYTIDVTMRSGRREIQLDYRDRGGEARVALSYRRLE